MKDERTMVMEPQNGKEQEERDGKQNEHEMRKIKYNVN